MNRTHVTMVVLTVVVCLTGQGARAEQLVTVNDWTYRNDAGDVGIPVFQVTMTFTETVATKPGFSNAVEEDWPIGLPERQTSCWETRPWTVPANICPM